MVTETVYVEIGEKVVIPVRSGDEELMWDTEALPPCDNNTDGHWFCATCKESAPNNIGIARHAQEGHRIGWMCHEHGLEAGS